MLQLLYTKDIWKGENLEVLIKPEKEMVTLLGILKN